MENIIVLTALYILIVAIAYRPKQNVTVNHVYVNYFPETAPIPCPWDGEVTEVTEPVKPVLYLLPPVKESPKTPSIDKVEDQLSKKTIRDLKKMAKGRVKNYSNMTKRQLIQALAA